MSKYAMVLLERVIDIVSSGTEPHYPPDINGNEVTAVLCDDTVVIGMGYLNGVFSEYIPEPQPEPQEPPLTEMEQTVLETSLNVEYLMCLAELNN